LHIIYIFPKFEGREEINLSKTYIRKKVKHVEHKIFTPNLLINKIRLQILPHSTKPQHLVEDY